MIMRALVYSPKNAESFVLKFSHRRIELVLEQRVRRNFILRDAARNFLAPDHCFARLRQHSRVSIDHRLQRGDIRRRRTISEQRRCILTRQVMNLLTTRRHERFIQAHQIGQFESYFSAQGRVVSLRRQRLQIARDRERLLDHIHANTALPACDTRQRRALHTRFVLNAGRKIGQPRHDLRQRRHARPGRAVFVHHSEHGEEHGQFILLIRIHNPDHVKCYSVCLTSRPVEKA